MTPTLIGFERQARDSDQLPHLTVLTTPKGVASWVLRISASPGWVRLSAAELKEHGSEPPHAGDRLPVGITMTHTLVLPTKPPSLATRHAARFDTRWTMSSVAIVSAYGDIDGSNASTLTDYALVDAAGCSGLVLDLTGLKFCGTEGFSALHRVSVSCAHAGIGWVVVPGAAVSRLLRLCDPHGSLPTVDTVCAALANLQDQHAGV